MYLSICASVLRATSVWVPVSSLAPSRSSLRLCSAPDCTPQGHMAVLTAPRGPLWLQSCLLIRAWPCVLVAAASQARGWCSCDCSLCWKIRSGLCCLPHRSLPGNHRSLIRSEAIRHRVSLSKQSAHPCPRVRQILRELVSPGLQDPHPRKGSH